LKDPKIINVRVLDLRFPTSLHQIGSDAVNRDPDYSAACPVTWLSPRFIGTIQPSDY